MPIYKGLDAKSDKLSVVRWSNFLMTYFSLNEIFKDQNKSVISKTSITKPIGWKYRTRDILFYMQVENLIQNI